MIRRLGNFEKLIYLADKKNSFNFVVVAHLKGNISHVVLREALNLIQPAYPLLNAAIIQVKEEYFFSHKVVPIELNLKSHQVDEQWIDEVNVELNTPFALGKAPLIRVLHLYSENQHEILMTFHHVIADAISGVHLLNHLISIVDQLMDNKKNISIDVFRMLPPIEDLLKSKIVTNEEKYCDLLMENSIGNCYKDEIGDEGSTVNTAIIFHQLSRENTLKLIDHCRANKVSVHSLICSAMCEASFRKSSYRFHRITCLNPVNMRPYLPVDVSPNEMGYLLSRVDAQQIYQSNMTLIESAEIINAQIKEAITLGAHIELLHNMQELLNMYSSTSHLHKKIQFEMPCIFLSNIGRINFNTVFSNFSLVKLHFSLACQGMFSNKDSMAATVTSYNEQMNINFHYIKPLVTEEEARKFSDAVIERLIIK